MTDRTEMNGATESPQEESPEERWIFIRPPENLNRLSDEAKWEVTRRHPYYQILWRIARPDETFEVTHGTCQNARRFLLLIGVQGAYPDPASPFSELVQGAVGRAWLQGAISRVSVRNLLLILIQCLDQATIQEIVSALHISASIDRHDLPAFHDLFLSIKHSPVPGLDLMIPELLFTVNPHASDKLITEVLTEAVQQYRREHDISLTRRREDNLKDYLRVWDLREGWDGNAYRSDHQRSLESVASQLGISKSTAYNRYRSAFENIIGHSYTPTRWWRTMGLLLPVDPVSWRVSLGRPINRRSRAAVAESRLGSDVESLDQQVNNPFLSTEIEQDHLRTLSIDIHELISRGLSNSEIVARLREDWEIEHEIDESLIESFRNIPYGPP